MERSPTAMDTLRIPTKASYGLPIVIPTHSARGPGAVIELPQRCAIERLVHMLVDTLGVAGCLRVEEAQKEFGLDVVMRGDGAPIGADLAVDQRLDEARGGDEEVEILHRL